MRILIATVVIFWSFTTITNAQVAAINWLTIEEVEEAQKSEPREVMMDVYTKWCGPCKMMMANTFTNANLIAYVNDNYYAVKFDAEHPHPVTYKGKDYSNPTYDPNKRGRNGVHELSRALGVNAYPTIVYFNENFDIITPISGYKQPRQLQVLLTFFNEVYSTELPSDKMQPIWDKYKETFVGTW